MHMVERDPADGEYRQRGEPPDSPQPVDPDDRIVVALGTGRKDGAESQVVGGATLDRCLRLREVVSRNADELVGSSQFRASAGLRSSWPR